MDIDAACVAYVSAKDAAYEYGVNMPAQTPAPERYAASKARDEALTQLIEVAEQHARAILAATE